MKLTVITVCYNAKHDLLKTLESIVNQTFNDMEYVVVDGGSTDGTPSLLDEYKERFERRGLSFRYVSEKDKGTYDAMNKGAVMAQGEWINYMNAGDEFYAKDTLERFFALQIDDDCGILYGDTLQIFYFGSGIAKA